jgi:hypothetical protein
VDRIQTVDIGDDELLPPWPTIFAVAEATDTTTWVLVGGLMTQVHARSAGIAAPRTTSDVDMVVDVAAAPGRFTEIANQLRAIGFEPRMPDTRSGRLHRFIRTGDVVDVMVPDHLPRRAKPRFMRHDVFEVEAGAQAVSRRSEVAVVGSSATVLIGVPNLVGALVIKGAAHTVDTRDRDRHLEDAAVLLAAINGVGTLPLENLSLNDRRRLRHLLDGLADAAHAAWLQLDVEERSRGQLNAVRLRTVLDRQAVILPRSVNQ